MGIRLAAATTFAISSPRRWRLHYERDPKYGRKLKIKKAVRWQWTDEDGRLSFSVNEVKCTTSPSCSIFVHPNADQYKHVWEISLDKLNEFFAKIDDKWIAQYQPIDAEPCPNRCHFVILSLEGTLTQTQLLMVLEALELGASSRRQALTKGKESASRRRGSSCHCRIQI